MLLKKPSSLSHEQFAQLGEALAYLSEMQKIVIEMRFWQDMSIQEIANRIRLNWQSTDDLIQSAINHLRVRLLQYAGLPVTGKSAKIYQLKNGLAA
ncbi:MAG: sigma-70 family RNA polymerase sigma factor [Bdellovibrionaceae bacterium]|nr:sigma-70 family RNA polymerase sigma factor [Pseudobdellovibrionaceae bacterium]